MDSAVRQHNELAPTPVIGRRETRALHPVKGITTHGCHRQRVFHQDGSRGRTAPCLRRQPEYPDRSERTIRPTGWRPAQEPCVRVDTNIHGFDIARAVGLPENRQLRRASMPVSLSRFDNTPGVHHSTPYHGGSDISDIETTSLWARPSWHVSQSRFRVPGTRTVPRAPPVQPTAQSRSALPLSLSSQKIPGSACDATSPEASP